MLPQLTSPALPVILDSIDEGILIVNDDNEITLFNPQFTTMWGIPSQLIKERDDEKTISFIIEQLIDPENFIRKIRELYRSEEEDYELIRFKDGRIFERHSAPFKTIEAQICRIWSFRDVTNQVNAELELKVYKNHIEKLVAVRTDDLEQANARLESFNYSVSHDLRSPLRAIEGFSSILQEEYKEQLDEQGQKYLNIINDSIHEMRSLIDNLLKLSQVTHNKLCCQTVDLGTMANNILMRLHKDEPDRKLKIDISSGMKVYADSALLNIALENLIGNAWKYSATKVETFIKVDSYIDKGQTVFFVKDNGIGFNMDAAHELFKPFKRLESSNKFSGNGVGLATVQRIILQHNGKIWAEAEPNNGATFYFILSIPKKPYVTH